MVAVVTTAVLAALTVGLAAQVPANRPRITGIDHIVFRASDGHAAQRFYGGVLGLIGGLGGMVAGCAPGECGEGRPSPQAIPMRLVFNVGQRQRIYIEPNLPAGEDERLRLLAFATPDLEALSAHLTAKGVAILLITDDLLELIGLSNRILIMRDGSLVNERSAPMEAKPTEQELVGFMV